MSRSSNVGANHQFWALLRPDAFGTDEYGAGAQFASYFYEQLCHYAVCRYSIPNANGETLTWVTTAAHGEYHTGTFGVDPTSQALPF